MKVPGYISLLRKNEKEGDCRDETLDSPCIHTHPPANTHYINQNNGSSREDPNYPAPSLTSSLEAARMCKGMKEKTYFLMKLLTAFSILLPLLKMCLLKQKNYCSWLISVSDLKKKSLKTKTLCAQHIQWHHYLISIHWFFPLFTPSLEHKSTVTATQCIILPCKATQPYNNLSLAITSSHTNEKNLGLSA